MNKREEDFEKSAMDYCEDHSHCIYFEAGAEYGYQYAMQHPQWIPVEEELPKERCKLYLVCDKYGRVCESAYDVEDDIWYRQSGTVLSPTHWMPLPQPPVKKRGEQ